MVCQTLRGSPTVGVFFSFYPTRPSTKEGWVTLDGLLGNAPFKPYSNHYKNWKNMFARVRGREDSQIVVGADDAYLFPLAWTDKLLVIMGYKYKYLPFIKENMVRLLEKFEVMESRTVVQLPHLPYGPTLVLMSSNSLSLTFLSLRSFLETIIPSSLRRPSRFLR